MSIEYSLEEQLCREAESGSAEEKLALARRYEQGNDVPQRWNFAVKWYIRSIIAGSEQAKQAFDSCIKNMKDAAENGSAKAQNTLGECFLDGMGMSCSDEKAFSWFLKAAENDHPIAQINVGKCYNSGKGTEKNSDKAAEWFQKGLQNLLDNYIETDDFEMMTTISACYQYGYGTEKNLEKGAEWAIKAAEKGSEVAQCYLGSRYEIGILNIEKDMEKAKYWHTRAAEQGSLTAQNNLGAYYDACGNWAEAMKWFTKAAEQGLSSAQYNLAVYYMKGNGIVQNKEKAIEWCTKSAEQGNAEAQHDLGLCYLDGDGVPKNQAKGKELLEKAASQGIAHAQETLYNLKKAECIAQVVGSVIGVIINIGLIYFLSSFSPAGIWKYIIIFIKICFVIGILHDVMNILANLLGLVTIKIGKNKS